MKKTLLAAALAVGFAGAAQATSVTLYGVVDGGIGYEQSKGNNYYSATQKADHAWRQANGVGANGSFKNTRTGLVDGVMAGNRWGLKGVEDLGDGLKAIFQLEAGYNLNNGNGTDRAFHRQATLGLQSDSWGKLQLGRGPTITSQWMPGIVNPFGAGWKQAGVVRSFSAASTVRYDNMIEYSTPNFSGFQFGIGYSFNASGNQSSNSSTWSPAGSPSRAFAPHRYDSLGNIVGPNASTVPGSIDSKYNNRRAVTAAIRYASGPLAVALSYDNMNVKRQYAYSTGTPVVNVQGTQSTNVSSWILGGSYDFEVVKLHLGFGQTRNGFFPDGGGSATTPGLAGVFDGALPGLKVNSYSLGVSAPIGGGTLRVGWQMADPRSTPDSWNVGGSRWDGLVKVDRFDPVTGARLTDATVNSGQRLTNAYTNYANAADKAAAVPGADGRLAGQVDAAVTDRRMKRMHTYSIGYNYGLSKRTNVYVLGSYTDKANFRPDSKSTLFAVGVNHTF